jgi:hypothetical protein
MPSLEEQMKELVEATQTLTTTLDTCAAKSGAHSFDECHVKLAEYRQLMELADLSQNEAGKKLFKDKVAEIPYELLAQQAGGYQLLKWIADGTHGSLSWGELMSRLNGMIAACQEVMK